MALKDGITTVTTAGTAVKIASTTTFARWLMVQGHDDNTGAITVGGSTVVGSVTGTERGVRAPQAQGATGDYSGALYIPGPLDLSKVYVDSNVNGDSCCWVYDDNAEPIRAGT